MHCLISIFLYLVKCRVITSLSLYSSLLLYFFNVYCTLYRDVKAGNILLNTEGHAKLGKEIVKTPFWYTCI